MVNLYKVPCPSIFYRPIRPSYLEVVDKLHADLFPIRYESEFFLNIVHGRDIVSWGAVDRNRSDGHSDELVGFVTARLVMAKGSEVEDVLRFETPEASQTLVYILTLGVVESYRNCGIGQFLLLCKYSTITSLGGKRDREKKKEERIPAYIPWSDGLLRERQKNEIAYGCFGTGEFLEWDAVVVHHMVNDDGNEIDNVRTSSLAEDVTYVPPRVNKGDKNYSENDTTTEKEDDESLFNVVFEELVDEKKVFEILDKKVAMMDKHIGVSQVL